LTAHTEPDFTVKNISLGEISHKTRGIGGENGSVNLSWFSGVS